MLRLVRKTPSFKTLQSTFLDGPRAVGQSWSHASSTVRYSRVLLLPQRRPLSTPSTSVPSSASSHPGPGSSSAPVPALILKPHINFKALAVQDFADTMAANIKNRNLPNSISVATVNALHRTVVEKTQQLDKARAERNRIAAEMKALFSGGSPKGNQKKNSINKDKAAATAVAGSETEAETTETKELTREAKEARRQELVERGRVLKDEIHLQEAELTMLENQLYEQAILIPNNTHPTTPIGPESAAQLIRVHGLPRLNQDVKAHAHPGLEIGGEEGGVLLGNESDYPLLDHVTLAKQLDLFDFESATAVTGARWYYLKNEAALLELALIQFATQRAVQAGFMPVITPDVVRPEVVQACGFQPRDEASQTYWVSTVPPGSNKAVAAPAAIASDGTFHPHQHAALCLVATAEIALAGMNMNKVLEESQLPIKMAGFGRAFRAEAGSRGAEVKGLYRVHQFSKVELFALTRSDPGESDRMLEEIRKFQENIFDELGLCYRVLDMPSEELGASAYKKYDIEAWMPGRNSWGEISSTSNCTDYQSRRLNIRYRANRIIQRDTSALSSSTDNSSPSSSSNSHTITEFAHTLNGTAMAIPRIIVALLETFQQQDGSVKLPECLWPYMAGVTVIRPKDGTRS